MLYVVEWLQKDLKRLQSSECYVGSTGKELIQTQGKVSVRVQIRSFMNCTHIAVQSTEPSNTSPGGGQFQVSVGSGPCDMVRRNFLSWSLGTQSEVLHYDNSPG
jgi:hypothetical protein